MSVYTDLKNKVKNKKAVITVVGLGYVGLPIALEFCKKGFKVNGLDTSKKRIARLKKKISYINDIPSSDIKKLYDTKRFYATDDASVIKKSDVIIVCVPTPLRKVKDPDISYILSANKSISEHLRSGQLVILESTTYPGTTREVVLPILEKNRLILNEDFFLAFSPERIDPGNEKYGFAEIPKVVGGMGEKATELGKLVYSQVVKKVVGVTQVETAEVTKLLENTFRIVNIGLINEFAMLCHKLNIDVWEVIDAAKTKPFGFMPFYPGPGIGGHCIPADPMYLSWKAKKVGFKTKMIDLAAQVNRMAPAYVVSRVDELLKTKDKTLKNKNIFVLGVSYKKDVNDLRESPAIDIFKILKERKAQLTYHDPFIPYLDLFGIKMKSTKLSADILKKQDIVILVTDHTKVNYKMVAKNSKLILDTRNVFQKNNIKSENIDKL